MGHSVSYTPSADKISYIDIKDGLSKKDLKEIIGFGGFDRIQCREIPSEETLKALNDEYYSKFPGTGFRLYGCHFETIDLSFLKRLSNVEKLSLDFIKAVSNPNEIARLRNLKKLRFAVEDTLNFDFIKTLPKNMEQLALETKKKTFDISLLKGFDRLRVLELYGYKENIEALTTLPYLENLLLRGVTLENLEFLNRISKLRSLKIHLGNTADFSPLYGNASVKALQLFKINNFTDTGLIGAMRGLEVAELIQLKRITRLPDLSENKSLKHISLDDMKSLTDISALEFAPCLESVSFSRCPPAFEPASILPVLRNRCLKQCSFYTASRKKNERINALIEKYGKKNANNFPAVRDALNPNSDI